MSDVARDVAERVVGSAKEILGRFALKGLKEAGGEETRRFEAHLALDGKVVAGVSNGGTGGCNMYRWNLRELEIRVNGLADEWDRLIGGFGFEQLDALVEALIERSESEKTKKRYAKRGMNAVALVHVGEKKEMFGTHEHWYGGKHYEVAAVTEEDLRKLLAEKYAGARVEVL